MKVVYICSSIIPSRTANSIHVMKMCQAFAKNNHEVILLCPDAAKDYELGVDDVYAFYGVRRCFKIIKLPWPNFKGRGYVYGVLAAIKCYKLRPDLVFGRNLIGCTISAFAKLPVMFEYHEPIACNERIKACLFGCLSHHASLKKFIVITHSLKAYYESTYPHLKNKIHVAPDGADPIESNVEPIKLANVGQQLQVGYVGNLYAGKGMEVITEMARICEWADFHVVGGTNSDLAFWESQLLCLPNLLLHGYVPQSEVSRYLISFDVLLLPNQSKVLAHGKKKTDISKWTSPLKAFEYMSAQKPIISSNLPVLKEIFRDEYNALLCSTNHLDEWEKALMRLRDDKILSQRIAYQAYQEFMESYTWVARVRQILEK